MGRAVSGEVSLSFHSRCASISFLLKGMSLLRTKSGEIVGADDGFMARLCVDAWCYETGRGGT
jgi:hypothetical protein